MGTLKDDDAVKPLTAILTLNTIAHTMGAAGVGSEVQKLYGEESLTLASVLLTLAVLFLSRLFQRHLELLTGKTRSNCGICSHYTTILLSLLIIPIQWLKKILQKEQALVTRDDVAALADLGEEEGILEVDEETVIHNLLRLREIKVHEVMTPRVVLTAFQMNSTIREIMDENQVIRFSRIPIYDESIDDIKGIIIRSQLLMAASRDEWDVKYQNLQRML